MDQRQVIAWCSGDSSFLGEPVCFHAVLLGHLFGQSIDLDAAGPVKFIDW